MVIKNDKKWKDALLKTSLPLEYLVADMLRKREYFVGGEYSFIRKNEQNVDTEFSVDLRASEVFKKRRDYWAEFNLLIECKYNYPGVKWIFAPHPEPLSSGGINIFQELSTKQIFDFGPLYRFSEELPSCIKGIELHDSDANLQSIPRGLYQLKYAVLQLALDLIKQQMRMVHDDELLVNFVCPILVTTASLHVFRRKLNLDRFQRASSLENIADQVEALIVYQERKPQIDDYTNKITTDLYNQLPELRTRLEQINAVRNIDRIWRRKGYSAVRDFDRHLQSSTESVLVVTYDAFDKVLSKVRKSIIESGQSVR
jgi:hypothetical protein